MYFRQEVCFKALVFLSISFAFFVQAQAKTLVFDQLGNNPPHQQATMLLKIAYDNLGIDLAYKQMPLSRSYREANLGRLDGLQGRVPEQSMHFPHLIKVKVPIIEFNVTIVADKTQCGDCDLEDITKAATVNGYAALNLYLNENQLPMHIDYVENRSTVQRLFDRKRVEAMIVSDVLVSPAYFDDTNRYRIHYLCKVQTFHYLHEKHHALVQPVTRELTKLLYSNQPVLHANKADLKDLAALRVSNSLTLHVKAC